MSDQQATGNTSHRAPIRPTEWGPSASSSVGESDLEAAAHHLELLFAQRGQPDDN